MPFWAVLLISDGGGSAPLPGQCQKPPCPGMPGQLPLLARGTAREVKCPLAPPLARGARGGAGCPGKGGQLLLLGWLLGIGFVLL